MKTAPYPLKWPDHQRRTRYHERRSSRFRALTFGRSRDDLFEELERMGARNVVLSSNIELRLDGKPRSGQKNPDDPGVAVYFNWKHRPYVIACDTYEQAKCNLRALFKTVEAMRAIERHGATDLLERAVSGFSALPAAQDRTRRWWEVLPIPAAFVEAVDELGDREEDSLQDRLIRTSALEKAEKAYKKLVAEKHPDRGGKLEDMEELNWAIGVARELLGDD